MLRCVDFLFLPVYEGVLRSRVAHVGINCFMGEWTACINRSCEYDINGGSTSGRRCNEELMEKMASDGISGRFSYRGG